MYRFNSFTQKANEVLNLAIKSAQNYGHNYVGSEHILYGLLKEGTGVGATSLLDKGITLDDIDNIKTKVRGVERCSPMMKTTISFFTQAWRKYLSALTKPLTPS